MNRAINTSSFREKVAVAGGLLLICGSIASYVYMHVIFFGVPHFNLNTLRGRSEIGYTLSSLVLVGIGAYAILHTLRARSKNI